MKKMLIGIYVVYLFITVAYGQEVKDTNSKEAWDIQCNAQYVSIHMHEKFYELLSEETFKSKKDIKQSPLILKDDKNYEIWIDGKKIKDQIHTKIDLEKDKVYKIAYRIQKPYPIHSHEPIINYSIKEDSLLKKHSKHMRIDVSFDDPFNLQNFMVQEKLLNKKSFANHIEVSEDKCTASFEWKNIKDDFSFSMYEKDPIKIEKDEVLSEEKIKKDEKALKICKDLLKIEAYYKNKYYDVALYELQKIKKNVVRLKPFSKKTELNLLLDYNLGKVYIKQKKYNEAIKMFTESDRLKEKNLYILYDLYEKIGNKKKSIECINQLRLKDKTNLATLWAKEKKYALEPKVQSTSYKGFIMIQVGIVILILVAFYNIKKQ